MKTFGLLWLCLLVFGLYGCASSGDDAAQGSSTAPRSYVPGEDVNATGGTLSPTAAPGGAGANVHF